MVPLERTLKYLKVLAHKDRLHIAVRLTSAGYSGSHLAAILGLTQPTLSRHMKKLVGCGIVRSWKIGHETCYRLVNLGPPEHSQILGCLRTWYGYYFR